MGVRVRLLCESVYAGGASRVDRDAGIIYGVKVLGRTSPNKHGLNEAVNGTEYTAEALSNAVGLYENLKVNVDHPPRDKPGKDRSAHDRLGKLVNVRVTDEGMFADLVLLKSHPLADRLMEAAEHMPDAFGLSHNAWGKGDVVNGKYVITEIPEVRSVDVVADAGTVNSLFESREAPVTLKKLVEILEGKSKLKKAFRRVLEDDTYASMPMEDAGGDGVDDHLCNAINAIVKGDGDTSIKVKKIRKLLKMMDEPDTEEEPVEEDDETDSEMDDTDNTDETPVEECDEGDRPMKESREIRRLKAENKALRVCMEAGIAKPAASLLKGMVHLSEPEMRELAASVAKPAGKGGQQPRSQSPGSARPTQEGRDGTNATVNGVPTDPSKLAAWLRN